MQKSGVRSDSGRSALSGVDQNRPKSVGIGVVRSWPSTQRPVYEVHAQIEIKKHNEMKWLFKSHCTGRLLLTPINSVSRWFRPTLDEAGWLRTTPTPRRTGDSNFVGVAIVTIAGVGSESWVYSKEHLTNPHYMFLPSYVLVCICIRMYMYICDKQTEHDRSTSTSASTTPIVAPRRELYSMTVQIDIERQRRRRAESPYKKMGYFFSSEAENSSVFDKVNCIVSYILVYAVYAVLSLNCRSLSLSLSVK